MKFTYDSYEKLLDLIKENEYICCGYKDWSENEKSVILRHDIDNSIECAYNFSKIEYNKGVKSTYFVLLNTYFYNVALKENRKCLKEIYDMGHTIGLHFDETMYESENIIEAIKDEKKILEELLEFPIECMSMHRPSKKTLESNYEIDGIVNSYSDLFFRKFKYISDSRHNWSENVEKIISSGEYNYLQILTHAFWYRDNEMPAHDILMDFVNKNRYDTYNHLKQNITNLDEFISLDEINTL